MTIYRKILRVKTAGSKREGNLRPALSDQFHLRYSGMNYAVLEYNETEGWCIIEAWCSDHPVLREHAKTMADLESLKADPDVIKEEVTHPLSPPIIGRLSSTFHDSIDEERKEIVIRGTRGRFIRKERDIAQGIPIDVYILDEG